MLKLKNVSKFYYANGIVTSGFTKVNLELNKGEFVAITGESGSGKSTLLNVISGLDTYEEGEMYINGEETSAYSSEDFEAYRNKYIANIYQSFNLINSYTVYQNVEMVLLLNGCKARERRKRILDVLRQVGLYEFRHARASRLSGGQKQRVAIARALVKDTPIIVADEPTGNLDSESAANVVQLLAELAKDRLVIVVTHNYDQIEPYVTRKITMYDGRITEDLHLREASVSAEGEETGKEKPEDIEQIKVSEMKHIRRHLNPLRRFKLGFRNAFNILPKFLLLLFIFAFIACAVTAFYANTRKQTYDTSTSGYNWFFQNTSDKRIVIKKTDGSPISAEEMEALEKMENVDYVFANDVMLDSYVYINDVDWMYYISGYLDSYENLSLTDADLTYGRMPQSSDEIMMVMPSDYYLLNDDDISAIFATDFKLYNDNGSDVGGISVRVTGIKAEDMGNWQVTLGVSEELLDNITKGLNAYYSTMTVKVADEEFPCEQWSMMNKVVPSDRIKPGEALVMSDWNWYFPKGRCKGQPFTVTVENLYYSAEKTFTITDTYTKKDFTKKTGYDDYDWNNGVILVNAEEYYDFFDTPPYQSSVFIEDVEQVRDTLDRLTQAGYTPLYIKDTLKSYGGAWEIIDQLMSNILTAVLMVVLFFIAYFIIKLIMRSRNVYFATVRMLGGTSSDCRGLIVVDLFVVMNIAFLAMLAFLYLNQAGYLQLDLAFIDTILTYMKVRDYALLYGVLAAVSLLISLKYSRELFKTSAMNVYKEV